MSAWVRPTTARPTRPPVRLLDLRAGRSYRDGGRETAFVAAQNGLPWGLLCCFVSGRL